MRTSLARWVNVVAGMWLFLSAWLFREPSPLRVMQGLLGMTVFLLAIVAIAYPRVRWLTGALALWTILSPFILALPATAGAENQAVVGVVILVAALVPGASRPLHGQAT